jgi:hypothetical protein
VTAVVSFRDLSIRSSYSAAEDRVNDFFVPVLNQALSYDRVTGYFKSSSLASVARGLARFVGHGGTMRLIAGAELDDLDVQALEDGESLSDVVARRLLADPIEGADIIAERRLETLAWLVREGRLEIRIGVPTDHLGRPLRPDQTLRYFHAKYGVFTDEDGNRIAFDGSNNETAAGYVCNYEVFSVFPSWNEAVWAWNGQDVVDRFEAHWSGNVGGRWTIVSLPEAVAEHLVERVKHISAPPTVDPEETREEADAEADQVRLEFVAAAPRLGAGTGVGYVTAGVEPWPHQLSIARRVVDSFPRSYLLSDEVGLGKTIEAGLILRELLVSGRASTALLLVPASVIRQWQEELDEKFSLLVPRQEGGRFFTRRAGIDQELPGPGGNPWEAFPVLLASSHLARRRDRRAEILAGGPWDVVLVDEAHHARRSGSKPTDTPNTLLALLQAMKIGGSWTALYLASATPMQMHAHEAWDLLELIGLTPRWSQSADTFTRYYTELRESFGTRHWEFLRRMSEDFFADPGAEPDQVLTQQVKVELGLAKSKVIRDFAKNGLPSEAVDQVPPATRHWMDEWLRRHTPMRDRVFRTTRSTLRYYKEVGLLDASATIPVRDVKDRFVPFTAAEQELYERIEAYISKFYDAYMTGPQNQKPLGFIMTVYRRRLTSSFLAIERSLQRRRAVLVGNAVASRLLDPDDLAALEYSGLLDIGDLPEAKLSLAAEVAELDDFLADLGRRPPDESKMTYLHNELDDAFKGIHDTAIVFTQYTDTMEYLRDQLVTFYGDRVACWSGRGGERWSPTSKTWGSIAKADLKRLFREGREVKILLGTDSMSEGLNLQTCALMINYDMPWNFMRVEQRIGRIDRIGGRAEVSIRNYFYKGTVEEQIYTGIAEDFDWFEDVVGPAQPVLGQVEDVIEHIAMRMPGADRDKVVVAEVANIRAQIEEAKARAVTIDDVGRAPNAEALGDLQPAIDLTGLEQVLTRAQPVAERFHPHPSINGAYLLEVSGRKSAVTFRRAVLEAHPGQVTLLTYGTAELLELLVDVPVRKGPVFYIGNAAVSTFSDLESLLSAHGSQE